ncbi:DMT family transporter [Aureimonas populi]|uniref:DMT family transporter n=1 Tax=Aureimonas populi TaxID=1701758 RepID=A0ABW5CQ65_9HYPH|nr:DMT family transporter [Aureimonas populi]
MGERRHYGLLLVAVAMLLWSTAGLFVRMIDVGVWDLILWRSLFAGGALLAVAFLWPQNGGTYGWTGFGASIVAAISMSAYAASLTLTSVANVLIIYATLPFFTAALAWALMGERSSRRMLMASALSLAGVAIVAGRSLQPSDMAGNGLAILMTVTFAGLLILSRRFPRTDLALVNAVAALLCVAAVLPFSSGAVPAGRDILLLLGLGVLTTALSFLLFLMGGRHIPSTEAALIGLLDVLLGPLWVWLAFAEHPGQGALVGGGIVLMAVTWYLLPGLGRRTGSAPPGPPCPDERAPAGGSAC